VEARSVLEYDIVAVGPGRPEAVGASWPEQLSVEDLAQERLRVVVELAGGRLVQDRGELSLELPGVEEELPVDEAADRLQIGFDRARAGEGRDGNVAEVDVLAVRAGVLDREQRLPFLLRVLVP